MPEWVRCFATWRNRRRRFAEEWDFHASLAASNLQDLGLSHREAHKIARRRLGSRLNYRRAALRESGADMRGLLDLLPLARWKKSPLLVPGVIAIAAGLVLILNPLRVQAVKSLQGALPFRDAVNVERLVPSTPSGVVPVQMMAIVLWTMLLIGAIRIAAALGPKKHWLLCVYAAVVLILIALSDGVCWVTALQILVARRWSSDLLQGGALIVFTGAFFGSSYAGVRFWWRDVKYRCPFCLRLLGMPDARGHAHDVLLEPLEVELICLYGHGASTESRWKHSFECGQ